MADSIWDDDDDDDNVNCTIALEPWAELPIDTKNSTDAAKVFTNNNDLYNQFLRGEGVFGNNLVYQYVDVQLQVCLYYTDGWFFFDKWYIYCIIDGTVYITLMNDCFNQVVAWWNGPSVVHL